MFLYYHSKCSCICRFKQPYIGSCSEVDECSIEIFFPHHYVHYRYQYNLSSLNSPCVGFCCSKLEW